MNLREVTVCNRRGLHARAAAQLVKRMGEFDATVTVAHRGVKVPATSIMGLMMLAAAQGSQLVLHGHGPQAEQALDALCDLISRKFDEKD